LSGIQEIKGTHYQPFQSFFSSNQPLADLLQMQIRDISKRYAFNRTAGRVNKGKKVLDRDFLTKINFNKK